VTRLLFGFVFLLTQPCTAQLLNLSGKGVAFDLKSPAAEKPDIKVEDEETDSSKSPKRTETESKKSKAASSEESSKTSICQCRGSNRGVCFCLKAGVKCGCNATKGSEWSLDPLKKTGRYFNPNEALKSFRKKTETEPVSYPVTVDAYDRLAWQVGEAVWTLDAGYRMANGQKDGTGRWLYKDGRMFDLSAKRVSQVTRTLSAVKGPPELPSTRRAIYFGATWCPGCVWMYRNTLPDLQEYGWRFGEGDNLHIQIVDADDDTFGLMQKHGITGLPTTLILEGSRVIDRTVGPISADQFRKAFYQETVP